MSFVVDGSQWAFDGLSQANIIDSIEVFLERVQTARQRGEVVWIGDDLQTRRVFGELDLWSLRSPGTPITLPEEIWQELSAWLLQSRQYLDEDNWPDGLDILQIQIDGEPPEANADVAWAHHNVRAGKAVGCISIHRKGRLRTLSSEGEALVHWVADEKAHRNFWRAAIVDMGDNEATLSTNAKSAFPDIFFHPGVFDGLRRLAGGYLALREEVRKYLAIFDDYGSWAFTFPPPAIAPGEAAGECEHALPSNQLVRRRFGALGLDVAPEKPNVRLSNTCRSAREIAIGGNTLYCHWHGKFERHRNRVYIHGPVPASGNKFVVAIFDEHLELP